MRRELIITKNYDQATNEYPFLLQQFNYLERDLNNARTIMPITKKEAIRLLRLDFIEDGININEIDNSRLQKSNSR